MDNAMEPAGEKPKSDEKPKRRKWTREQIRVREAEMWEMRCKGKSLLTIGNEYGVTQAMVHRILGRVERRLADRMVDVAKYAKMVKVRHSRLLQYIAGEALDAWERSKKDAKSQTKRVDGAGGKGKDGTGKEVLTAEIVSQNGDTAYLDAARAAMADERKIWGADAPTKIANTDPSGDKEAGVGLIEDLAADIRGLRMWKPQLEAPKVVEAEVVEGAAPGADEPIPPAETPDVDQEKPSPPEGIA